MSGSIRVPRGQARFASGALAAFALVTFAALLAAWQKYQLLAGPLVSGPYVDNPLVEVDTYFRNLTGWRTALLVMALLQFRLWLANMRDVEFMAFPRLPGVAEVAWSPAGRDWEQYRRRLAAQAAHWTALGINFYRSPAIAWPQ